MNGKWTRTFVTLTTASFLLALPSNQPILNTANIAMISRKKWIYQCAAAKCPSPGEVVGKLVPKNHRHAPNPAMSFFLQFLSILYNSPRKSHVCSSISHSHPMNFILFPSFRPFAAPSHRVFAASKKHRAGWFSRDASASDHESLPGTWEKQIGDRASVKP